MWFSDHKFGIFPNKNKLNTVFDNGYQSKIVQDIITASGLYI